MLHTKKAILIGLAVFACFCFWALKKITVPAKPEEEASHQSKNPIISLNQERPTAQPGLKIPYKTLVNWEQRERDARLKRIPIKIENGNMLFTVLLSIKGVCFPGDADAIEKDLKAAPNHKLLATIESLTPGGPSYSWDVPDNFLKERSAKKNFTIPLSDRPQQYGFFVCTANSNDQSCRNKVVRDVNDIFLEHLRKDVRAGQELRNIFFQYLILGNTGMITFSDTRNDGKKFELLKEYLKEREVLGTNPLGEADAARENMKILQSLPFSLDETSIKIELPQYDEKTCG